MWLIALCVWSRQDLREKNWKTMEALTTVERTRDEKLLAITKAKVSSVFLCSSDATVVGETFNLTKSPKMLALGCLPPFKNSADPTLLPASPKLVLRAMYHSTGHGWRTVRMGEPGGTFRWFSTAEVFSVGCFPCASSPL